MRSSWVVLFAAAIAALTLSGCEWLEPKYPSPETGKPVTAIELYAEQQRVEAKQKREQSEEREKLSAEQAAAKAELTAKTLAADRAYKARLVAAKKANADAQAEADLAKADYEAALEGIGAEGAATVETLTLKFNALDARQQAAATELHAKYTLGLDTIQYKQDQRGAVVSGVLNNPLLGQIPVVGPALQSDGVKALAALVVGGGGIGFLNRRAGKKADGAYDEGYAKAKAEFEEQRAREHAAWDQSQLQMLSLLHQPPAALIAGLLPAPATAAAPPGSTTVAAAA